MKKTTLLSSLLSVIVCVPLAFAEPQTITLKDGSQIRGELTGVGGGIYTVQTPTLGEVKVNSSEVANISSGAPVAMQQQAAVGYNTQPQGDNLNVRVQEAQTKLMNDPAMMQQLQALAQDPELMRLLSDPALVQAVTSRNVQAVENNPKAQQLMNNPKIRALMEQMQASGQY